MEKRLIVRGDDFGITHSCNLATEDCFNNGILTSAGIMAPGAWAEEAATMAKANPSWCVGVHLTMVGEWQGYRLRPVLPYSEVNTLVDGNGFLNRSPDCFYSRTIDYDQLEREFMAQVDLVANRWGVDIGYLDWHYMGATPEYLQAMKNVAKAFSVPLSNCIGEKRIGNIYSVAPDQKQARFLEALEDVDTESLWYSIHHVLQDDPESRALKYFDTTIEPAESVAKHRSAEAATLTSKVSRDRVDALGIRLISYRDVKEF